jgi:hypothetical protein
VAGGQAVDVGEDAHIGAGSCAGVVPESGEAMSQTSTLWVASVLALGAVMFPIWKELSVISEHLAEIRKLLEAKP